jgi:hypothetical protein
MSRKFEIAIFAAACLVVAAALSICVPAPTTSGAQACINNLRQIDAACLQYSLNNSLDSAVQAFVKDRKTHWDSTVPDTVTLQELVSEGYLANSLEQAGFKNAVVNISTRPDSTNSKAVWIWIRYADGYEMRITRDGTTSLEKKVPLWTCLWSLAAGSR